MRTRSWALMALLILGATALLAAETAPLVKLLPKTGEVAGWKIYAGTLQYAKGEKLTDIYDGGYELYTKKGVQDAATQVYSNGKVTLTVTLHTMTSANAAKAFLDYWKKESGGRKLTSLKIGDGAFYYTADGATNGYLISGRCFTTIMATAADKPTAAAEASFMRAIARRAR